MMVAKTWRGVCATLMVAVGLTAVGPAGAAPNDTASTTLADASGNGVGTVVFTELDGGRTRVDVRVTAAGITPVEAFHGFHVHANDNPDNGSGCVAAAGGNFVSADGHYAGDGTTHGDHAGDMPVLYVRADGTAEASHVTDAFTVPELVGRAVIVHAGPDNYANIPPDRYTTSAGAGPDATTQATGDAGARLACGVIASGGSAPAEQPITGNRQTSVALQKADGSSAGTVTFAELGGRVEVRAEIRGITDNAAAFHAFHVHSGDRCERAASQRDHNHAAGHLGHEPPTRVHGDHLGDMPVLYVGADGTATARYVTDAFTFDQIQGRTVIVHEKPDNYGNIPDERYDSTTEGGAVPDDITKATGDAGARLACGMVEGVARVAGADRVATAVAASRNAFPTAGTAGAAVLARKDRFPDALAGAPLAARVPGPMLLTASDALDATVEAELKRAVPAGGTVYLLGGEVALSDGVAKAVSAAGFTVERIHGDDRFATAVALARTTADPQTVFVVDGRRFPDALSAGPAAASVGGVTLFSDGNQRSAATDAYLSSASGQRLVAVGGAASAAYPEATTKLVGADRTETARRVADEFFPSPLYVGLVRRGGAGDDGDQAFPDGLAAAPTLGRLAGPLLLVGTDDPAAARTYICERTSVARALVFGGPAAVSQASVDAVNRAFLGGNFCR